MSRRATDTVLDPALAVAGLLTRLGLFLLVVVTPLLAMVSRRGVAVFVPIATALLIVAAALDGRLPAALARFGQSLLRPASLALVALLVLAAVSLAWTPGPRSAFGHWAGVVLTLALFAGALACLPERVRASDVNLIPLGVAVASVALALQASPDSPVGFVALDRGSPEAQRSAMLVALLVWPGLAVLVLRGRLWQAGALALVAGMTLWLVHDLAVLAAFLAGLIAFLATTRWPRAAAWGVGALLVALLLLAPLVGWVMARSGGWLLPRAGDELVAVWRDVTYALPVHPVLGFGFDASAALTRGVGGTLLGSPRNAALQVWLELGAAGVALSAIALGLGAAAMAGVSGHARPAASAVLAAGGVMMFSGLAAFQGWWLGLVGLTAISSAFVARRRVRWNGRR